MISYPDSIRCHLHGLLLKKVTAKDIDHIWEVAPLNKLFLVIGCEAADKEELITQMQLDWTTWYLIMDPIGFTYGLLRAIPEMDDSISLHGIGWTQPSTSPRIFVYAWYAFHFWLFSKYNVRIKTYCDVVNTNAIKFDLKTGYAYDYWMPTRSINGKSVHLKIEKESFFRLMVQKEIEFELKESDFSNIDIPEFKDGKAMTSRSKPSRIEFIQMLTRSDQNQFIEQHHRDTNFYFFHLIPNPEVYSIHVNDCIFGHLMCSDRNGQKTIVIFLVSHIDLSISLDFVSDVKQKFNLRSDDIVFLDESRYVDSMANALSIHFKFSGNHTSQKTTRWVV